MPVTDAWQSGAACQLPDRRHRTYTSVKRAETLLVNTRFYDEVGTRFHTMSLKTFYTAAHPPAASQLVIAREEEPRYGKILLVVSNFAEM